MEYKNKFLNSKEVKKENKKEYAILFYNKDNFDKNKIDKFNQKLKEFIELQKVNEEIDLSYICFPNEVNFIDEKNNIYTIFKDTKLISSDEITLNEEKKQKTTFIKNINLRSSCFLKEVVFRECIFESEVILEGVIFKDIVSFRNAEFKKDFSFDSTQFSDIAYFMNANFNKNVNFESSYFNKFAYFEESKFHKIATFKDTYVEKMINFHNVKLKKIDLENSNFGNVNFLGLECINNAILTIDNFCNKDSARIIKAHFEKENNITEANKYFVIEQELYLDLLKNKNSKKCKFAKKQDSNKKQSSEPNRIINIISLWFNKYVSNYGTDWVRVLIVIFGFGFLASIGYSFFEQTCTYFSSHKYWFIDGLIFSFILYGLYFLKYIKSFIFTFIIYCLAFYFLPCVRELTNNIATLINPLNIFKQNKEYFKDIVIYGVFVKGVVSTLIYQFIISFRNSTRRK